MVDYDGAVLEQLADRLNTESNRIGGTMFVLLGGAAGFAAVMSMQLTRIGPFLPGLLVVIGLLSGWRLGRARSLELRTLAQLAAAQAATRRTP